MTTTIPGAICFTALVVAIITSIIFVLVVRHICRRSKNNLNKYYLLSFDYNKTLKSLDKYENVLLAFQFIYYMYTYGTDNHCVHEAKYKYCSKCKRHNDGFLVNVHESFNNQCCIWLRAHIDDNLYYLPYFNIILNPICREMKNTIKHHEQIKSIVEKLRAFYNKYDSEMINNDNYKKYRPYIIKYFEQYDADEIDITRNAQVVKFDANKIISDYEKKEQ